MGAYALCGSLIREWRDAVCRRSWWSLVDYELSPYPLRSMCRDLYSWDDCTAGAS